MAEKHAYKIHLWTRGTNSRIPVEDVDAEDRLHAAAIGLRFFQMRRFDISPKLAHVDMENLERVEFEADKGETGTVLVSEVVAWLRQQEQANFVKENELEPLLKAFDGR